MTVARITFGIIVLNGEPFTQYNLRSIYPYAHEIIIAEGASPKSTHAATPDGHSVDGTLEILRRFKAEEDPEHKITIVTAEDDGHPNGFWPAEKTQQSQAYARRATGDWLWQIDIDEFYHPHDIERIANYLAHHPETTCMTFEGVHFWGGFDYVAEGGLFMHRQFQGEAKGRYRRILKWQPGFHYDTHRPPTLVDQHGRDITKRSMRFAGAIWPHDPPRLYHYYMIFPHQFTRKGAYYQNQNWKHDIDRLSKNSALLEEVNLKNGLKIADQYGTANWLARFKGSHPPQIEQMRNDIASGRLITALRHTDDIERLLDNPSYQAQIKRQRPIERKRALRTHLQHLLYYGPRNRLVQFLREMTPHWLIKQFPVAVQEKFKPYYRRDPRFRTNRTSKQI